MPGFDAEVAEECGGIRSSIVLFIVSVLTGHLYLRTFPRKMILALAVFPIAILKNAVRITILIYLAAYVDKAFITNSWMHQSGGIPFFVLALLLMVPVVVLLKKSEKKASGKKNEKRDSSGEAASR